MNKSSVVQRVTETKVKEIEQNKKSNVENDAEKAAQRNNSTIRAWFVVVFCDIYFFYLNGLFFFPERDKRGKRKKTDWYQKTQKGQHN